VQEQGVGEPDPGYLSVVYTVTSMCKVYSLCRSKEAVSLILGNLVLVQCQGIVVGFLASLAGIAMGWIPVGTYIYCTQVLSQRDNLMRVCGIVPFVSATEMEIFLFFIS